MSSSPHPFGERSPGLFDSAVMAATGAMPNNWLGLRVAIALRRLVTMRMDSDAAFDVVRFGMRMRLYPRDNGCEKGVLFTSQMFEREERIELLADIDRAIRESRDFVFVDIGANVGMFSLLVAAHAGRRADILAFEPDQHSLERLRFNAMANPDLRIRIMPVALWDAVGELALNVDLRDRGGTRTTALADATTDAARVPCRPLIDVLREQDVTRIDALKIDTEGSEDRVLIPFLRAADPALLPRLMIIEDTRNLWQADLFGVLEDQGYKVSSRSKLNVMLRRTF